MIYRLDHRFCAPAHVEIVRRHIRSLTHDSLDAGPVVPDMVEIPRPHRRQEVSQ
jgi:hypothetical protein